jgi:putative exosortase-associated protein (TIGR04073 family)
MLLGLVLTMVPTEARAEGTEDGCGWLRWIEMYVWNRLADFAEVADGGIALGPTAGLELAFTDYAQIGAYAATEKGVTWPDIVPPVGPLACPLWGIAWLDGQDVFDFHGGSYWTWSLGPWRDESTSEKEVRFRRTPWGMRAQVGLGIVHLYSNLDLLELGDFVTGLVCVDFRRDDQEVRPNLIRTPWRQLGRGLSNVGTGLWEVPYNVHLVNKDQGGFAAVTYGLIRGLRRFVIRESVGVLEVVTWPFGWEPIIEPEFPFEPVKTTEWRINEIPFRGGY